MARRFHPTPAAADRAPAAHAACAILGVLLAAALAANLPAGEPERSSPPGPADAVFPKSREEMEALARRDPLRVLRMARDWSAERVRGYTCHFLKLERIDGELQKPEKMRMKFRADPFSVYLKWIEEPSKGQEVIYVEGAYDGKVQVHPSGLLGMIFRRVALDPHGKTARSHSRRPITMAGLANMIRLVARQCEEAARRGDLTLTYEGIRHDGGRPSYVFKRVLPEGKGYPCETLLIFIDTEYLVCVRTDAYNWGGELISHYFYTQLDINPGLTDKDFDPDNRDYGYRLF